MKITALPIVFMFLVSFLIIPISISYAAYDNSPAFTTPTTPSHTNQTSTNMTTPTPVPANQTSTNMTTPTPVPANQTSTTPKPSTPLTPLKQFKSGVSAKDVQCQSGFSLVLKASDGSPACVHPAVVQILILRGWAAVQ